MKSALPKTLILSLLPLSLLSCSPSAHQAEKPAGHQAEKSAGEPKLTPLPVIDMVLTDEFTAPVPVKDLAFVPNAIPWVGRIILLGENGTLLSTNIDGYAPKPVGAGPYLDLIGLDSFEGAGVFLALDKNGQTNAFVESDDTGNFKPLALEGMPLPVAASYCILDTPKPGRFSLLGQAGRADVEYEISKTALTIKSVQTDKTASGCGADNGALSYTFSPENAQIMVTKTGDTPAQFQINIPDHFSTNGIKRAKGIVRTTANYGTTYRGGVIAILDNNAHRIGFISDEYARKQIPGLALEPPAQSAPKLPEIKIKKPVLDPQ